MVKKIYSYLFFISSFLFLILNLIVFQSILKYEREKSISSYASSSTAKIELVIEWWCGDGTCNEDENCLNCPEDCGSCITYPSKGGGGGVKEVKVSLNIIVPPLQTINKTGKITFPIILENNGDVTLSKINLTASILENGKKSNASVSIFPYFFEEMLPGIRKKTNLTVNIISDKVALYEISILAKVESPQYNTSNRFYINFVEREKNISGVKKLLIFTEEMIAENPECYELKEMLDEAKKLFEEGKLNEAVQKANEVIEACKKSIVSPEEVVYPTPKRKSNILIYGGIALLVLLLLVGIIFPLYRLIIFRRLHKKRKKRKRA